MFEKLAKKAMNREKVHELLIDLFEGKDLVKYAERLLFPCNAVALDMMITGQIPIDEFKAIMIISTVLEVDIETETVSIDEKSADIIKKLGEELGDISPVLETMTAARPTPTLH